MKHVKDFDKEKIAEYTDEELKMFINQIIMQRSVLQQKCADEMQVYLGNEKFDIYSRSGERKINKISEKYAGYFAGADYLEEIINTELKKREKYNEEQKYSGRSIVRREMSKEEFLEKEQDKTWAYKSKIE
ncbi:MAG: hypothetical protein IJ310_01915 [Clostridia bacterium]|nr:hypothetical protein [Clostridiales bacterium]MBQ7917556.1 hypothetical protein [Clostridia bacterium]